MGKERGGNLRSNNRSTDTTPESMAMINMNNSQAFYRQIFDNLDTNGDGYLKKSELKSKLRNASNGLSDEQIKRLYREADVNGDERLTFTEFVNMMNSPKLPETWREKIINSGAGYVKWVVPPRSVGAPADTEVPDGTEYIEEFNCKPPPLFIILISVVELAVFIYYAIDMGKVTASGPVPMTSPLIYNPYKRYQAWRFLSYMLIHSGYMHITFNLLMQLLLGIPLEMVHKWWRVAIVYFAGVIAGSLGTSISDPTVFLAGASAGDYAIITAHLSTVILNWKEMVVPWLQLLFFVIIIGTDVGVAVYNRYANAATDRTGYSAHLAGAVAGLLVGVGVLRNLKVRPWEKKLWWACLILYATLMLIAIIWNAAFPEYFPPSE